jgi:Ca-activated chloride channel homolog
VGRVPILAPAWADMSFAAPLLLLGLPAIPVLVAWYAVQQRGRRRAGAAFALPRMASSVAPRRPGWRRHVPMLALLLAVAALIVAAARPRVVASVSVERLATMLALDMSSSMDAADEKPNRATAAQRAAIVIAADASPQASVGVMQFNQAPVVLQLPTHNRAAVFDALNQLQISGGTSIGDAIRRALSLLYQPGEPAAMQTPAAIVLLSDGTSTSGPDPIAAAHRAARLHIPIFTVSIGTTRGTIVVPADDGSQTIRQRVPTDPQALAQIARASGGRAYTATDAGLSAVGGQLGLRVGHRNVKRELTEYLVGIGFALALMGAILSLRWFGRLI